MSRIINLVLICLVEVALHMTTSSRVVVTYAEELPSQHVRSRTMNLPVFLLSLLSCKAKATR